MERMTIYPHTATGTIEAYLSTDGNAAFWTDAVGIAILVGAASFVGLIVFIVMHRVWFLTAMIVLFVSAIAVTIFGSVQVTKWEDRTAKELSEHYGVTVTQKMLSKNGVWFETMANKPFHFQIVADEDEVGLVRNQEDGSFEIPTERSDLYLIVDGKVIEVMSKSGEKFNRLPLPSSTPQSQALTP